jgi:disulfide bond formation protein DsbB
MNMHSSQRVLAVLALASAGALSFAFISQYGFDLWPCLLCTWQRPAYWFVLLMCVLGLTPAVDAESRKHIVLLCAGLFLMNAGIAFYHVGVEEKWWLGPSECVGQMGEVSLSDIMDALNKPGRLGCTEAAFRLFGISMAGYNAIASVVLAVGSICAARKPAWWTNNA